MVSQKIYVMRHSERVDFVFGHDWFDQSHPQGKYVRFDSNLPTKLAENASAQQYEHDAPITKYGEFVARTIGESMKDQGVQIDFAFSSPALRCVETCTSVLEGLGLNKTVQIKLEPGLFEWGRFIDFKIPTWFNIDELKSQGHNIDALYQPVLTRDYLLQTQERLNELYLRGLKVTTSLSEKYKDKNLLFVGHGITLDVCSRFLLGEELRYFNEIIKIMSQIEYCGFIELHKNGNEWSMTEPSVNPLTHTEINNFDWRVLTNKL